MLRHDKPVDVSDDVSFIGKGAGSGGVRGGNQQQELVADKDDGRDDGARFPPESEEKPGREHPRETDPGEDAREAQRGEFQVEKLVVDKSERDKDQSAAEGLQEELSFCRPTQLPFFG